jgi:hypothetical protein
MALGRGYMEGRKRKIACGFDLITFDKIRLLANKNGYSFSRQVELLVEKGLKDEASRKNDPDAVVGS